MSEQGNNERYAQQEAERRARVDRARAIGGWMHQEWSERLTEAVASANHYQDKHKAEAEDVFGTAGRIATFVKDLRSAPDVQFQMTDGGAIMDTGLYDRTSAIPQEPAAGVYRYTGDEYVALCGAVNDRVNNPLTVGDASAQTLKQRGISTWDNTLIHTDFTQIGDDVRRLQMDEQGQRYAGIEIRVTRGEKTRYTMTPIPPSPSQS